jgi:hypothetical protein
MCKRHAGQISRLCCTTPHGSSSPTPDSGGPYRCHGLAHLRCWQVRKHDHVINVCIQICYQESHVSAVLLLWHAGHVAARQLPVLLLPTKHSCRVAVTHQQYSPSILAPTPDEPPQPHPTARCAGALPAMMESLGDYFAAADISGAPPPPTHTHTHTHTHT